MRPYLISTDLKELIHLLKLFFIIVRHLLSAYASVFQQGANKLLQRCCPLRRK